MFRPVARKTGSNQADPVSFNPVAQQTFEPTNGSLDLG